MFTKKYMDFVEIFNVSLDLSTIYFIFLILVSVKLLLCIVVIVITLSKSPITCFWSQVEKRRSVLFLEN